MRQFTKAWLWVRRPVPLVLVGAAGVVALLAVLLGPVAYWATTDVAELTGKEKADAINSTRQILLAAAVGAAAIAGLAFYYLSRRGQYLERFGKAIAQLAADTMTERLGGIYALEHIMVESARDHATIVEVLAAFVRERTGSQPPYRIVATDVQAALTVLGRRPRRPERYAMHLQRTDVCGADLAGLRLDGADLRGAQMQDVTLAGARLHGAEMYLVDLRGANLDNADLRGAHLGEANLRGASLRGADLRGADLVTTVAGTLGRSYGLTARRLARTRMDEHTVLPAKLRPRLLQYQRQRLHRALLVHLEQRQLQARRAGDPGVG